MLRRAGQQRRDDRHDERPTPDLAHGLGGGRRLNDREPFGFESASNLLALRADFVDDKDRRHRDLSAGAVNLPPKTPFRLRFPFWCLAEARLSRERKSTEMRNPSFRRS